LAKKVLGLPPQQCVAARPNTYKYVPAGFQKKQKALPAQVNDIKEKIFSI
jgi:hypothetical protein